MSNASEPDAGVGVVTILRYRFELARMEGEVARHAGVDVGVGEGKSRHVWKSGLTVSKRRTLREATGTG